MMRRYRLCALPGAAGRSLRCETLIVLDHSAQIYISRALAVPAQCAGEALHCIEARLLCVLQPDSKLAAVFASQNAAEPHGESSHFSEVRQFAFERVNLRRLSACQTCTRPDARLKNEYNIAEIGSDDP
jgi:hypothetical protein